MTDNTTPRTFGETLDIKEAAALLRLGYDSMKERMDEGAVPAVVLNQKHTVLRRDDLLAYVRDEGRKQAEERRRKQRTPIVRAVKPSTGGRARTVLADLDALDRATKDDRPDSSANVDRLLRIAVMTEQRSGTF